jgi:hypothetical protein
MYVTVHRTAVQSFDARNPGYRAALEAIATETSDTHYTVPRDAYGDLWRQYAKPVARTRRRKRVALGDAVERMLSSIGITKELVQRITRKPCKCPARQKWLNQWGYEKQAQVERIVKKAARWYGIT